MAELADALDLGSSGYPCRFKSCHPHHDRMPVSHDQHSVFYFVDIIIGLAMLVAIGVEAFIVSGKDGLTLTWQWYLILPILSIIFLMMAHKAMSRDKKMLRDSDRLR